MARCRRGTLRAAEKQGRVVYGIDMARSSTTTGASCPGTAGSSGDLLVRGPWVIARYFKGRRPLAADGEGWFPTGDVATIDADGFMQITDRSKDVIKSGGEWISSIDLENIAMATRRCTRRPASRRATRSGTSGRCWWW
jgi:acyl-CoA synthetase (AMP-forming)/AMP-acid ligase II